MKRLLSVLAAVLLVMGVYAQTVIQTTAGNLASALGSHRSESALVVKGTINGKDFELLKQLGATTLTDLDLSEAEVQSGAGSQAARLHQYAFMGAKVLRRVVIPNSVTFVHSDAFRNCPALERIETADNKVFASQDGILYRGKSSLVRVPQGYPQSHVVIPEGVRQLLPSALRDCKHVVEVTLPGTMQGINDMAFVGCSALKTLRILARHEPAMENAFDASQKASLRVVVPVGLKVAYNGVLGWKDMRNVVEE